MILYITISIIVLYCLLIISLLIGFLKLPKIQTEPLKTPETSFAVIVPFRNEAFRLPDLLSSILKLEYPKSHVSFWFVDDASEDNSVRILENFSKQNPEISTTILSNKRISLSPKKDAIRTAIEHIKNDWIVTTDADCILPEKWLLALHQEIIINQPKMIAAPVKYVETNSFFTYFQQLDFLSLQGTTIGSFGLNIPFMCNGANLAYRKKAFMEVQGFSGNDTIASGDDVFLLEKFIHKWPKKVSFLKSTDAIVATFPVTTFKTLISQRVRWASKSSNYSLISGKLIGITVLLANLLICLLPLFLLLQILSWKSALLLFLSKVLVDLFFLYTTASFMKQSFGFLYFMISSLLYPFFSIFIVFKSIFGTYVWKTRTFKR